MYCNCLAVAACKPGVLPDDELVNARTKNRELGKGPSLSLCSQRDRSQDHCSLHVPQKKQARHIPRHSRYLSDGNAARSLSGPLGPWTHD